MKAKLDYKNKKVIILAATILVLLGVAIFGVTMFLKSDDISSAAGEDLNQSRNQEQDNNSEEKLPVAGEDSTENNETANTDTEESTNTNNSNVQENTNVSSNDTNVTSNTVTNIADGRTTTETTEDVPNNEYVVERTETQERKVKEDFLVGWTPIELSVLAISADWNADIPELVTNKTAITKSGTNAVSAGEEIQYEITVKNNSDKDLKNINISDKVPEGTEYVEKTANNKGIFRDQKIVWKVNISKKSEIKVIFKVRVVKTEGNIENLAVVNGKDTNKTENVIIKYNKTSRILRNNEIVPSPAKPGDKITYNVAVTNTSKTTKTDAIIKDEIPEQTTLEGNIKIGEEIYTQEQLKTGINVKLNEYETKILEFTVQVKQDATGKIKNTAVVSGNPTNPSDNDLVNIKGIKTSKPNGKVKQGDEITYNIKLTNTGNVSGTVTVTDKLPEQVEYVQNSINENGVIENGEVTWANVEVKPEETKILSFKVKVKQDATGTISNIAKIDNEPTPEVKNPIITFEKVSEPVGKVTKGDTIKYKVKVTNTGEVKAENIVVKDKVPEGTTLKEIQKEGVKGANEEITWTIKEIEAGNTEEVSFEVTVNDINDKDKIRNTATVDGKETNETENEYVEPIITRAKTANKTTVKEEDEITYTITASNNGGLAKDVVITDRVPENTTFVSAENDGKEEKGIITWNVKVPEYSTVNVRFKVKVNKDVTGTIKNAAKIDDEPTPEVKNPIITFEKVSEPVGKVTKGDTIKYKVKVTNTGEVKAENIVVKDKAPEGTTLKGIQKEGVKGANEEITWTIKEIEVGKTEEVSFEVTVNDINDKDKIRNTATVDGKETNETENEYVEPVITRAKTANKTTVKEEDEITYTITASNNGGLAKDVVITDRVPENTTFVSAENDGKEEKGIITWNVEVPEYSTVNVRFKVKVNKNVIGTIKNIAKIDDEPTTEVKNPIITFEKVSEPVGKVTKGDTIKYKVKVTNTGEVKAENIVVKDKAPEGTTLKEIQTEGIKGANEEITWTIKEIEAGKTEEVSFEVTVNDINDKEKIRNTATVDGKETNETENEYVEPVIEKGVKSSIPVSGTAVKEKQKITYTIIVNNNGGLAKDVVITDRVPENTTFVSAENDGKEEKGIITWNVKVPEYSQTSVKFTVQVKVTEQLKYSITNTAKVDGKDTNTTLHEVQKPELDVRKSATINTTGKYQEKVHENDIINYTITVTNRGFAETEEDVIITDKVPENTTFISVENDGKEENGEVTWNIGKLNKGDSKTVTFKVKVDKLKEGYSADIKNIASANGKKSNKVENKVVKDNVQLEKTNTPQGDVKEGDTINYTITLTNKNGGEGKKVILKDTVPLGTTLVKDSITLNGEKIIETEMNNKEITVNPNEKYELKFAVTVNTLPEGTYKQSITNTAVMVKDGVETSKTVGNIAKKSNIVMKKYVDKSEQTVGGDLKYKIELTNSGEIEGTSIISDTIPTGTVLKGDIVVTDKLGTRNINVSELAKGINVTVEAKQTSKIEFTVTVNNDQYGQTISNTATIKKNPNDEGKTDTVTTKILEKNIKVTEISNVIKATNFVLVIDVSSSMTDSIGKGYTKIKAAKEAAVKFVNDIYVKDNTSTFTIVVFAKDAYTKTITFKNSEGKTVSTATKKDQAQLIATIKGLETDSGTNIYSGLVEAKEVIYSANGLSKNYPNNANVMIVLGDGYPYGGDENNQEAGIIAESQRIKTKGAKIYSIAFGQEAAKENSKAWRILKGISSNDKIYTSTTAAELSKNFEEISKDMDTSRNISTVNGVANIKVNGTLKIDSTHKLKIMNGTTIIRQYESLAEIEADTENHLKINSDGNIVWSIKDCESYANYNNLAIEYYLND